MSADTDRVKPGVPRLSQLDMRDNAFDTIRLIAATAVILSHAFPLTGIAEPLEVLTGGQASIGHLAVCIFFLISGYLVPASLDRGTIGRFASKRAYRILPGLVVAVLICAFVLGPLVTTVALSNYFTDPLTLNFLGNIAFLPVGYSLPGVFMQNPMDAVNGSLWSLRYEVACYILVPFIFACGRWRTNAVIAGWLVSFALAALVLEIWQVPGGFHIDRLSELFRFFGAGMLFYLLADRIPMRKDWAVIAVLVCVPAVFTPVFVEVIAVAGSYAVMYFAYHAPRAFKNVTARGDISYGVYVYAFPIQQLLISVSIAWAGTIGPAWLVNFLLALPLTVMAGVLSWVAVEKPFIRMGSARPMKPVAA